MEEKVKPSFAILLTGILGALGALIVGVAELALHFTPSGEYSANYRFFLDVPRSRLIFGHFFSVHTIPLYFLGYWHLFHMLKPAHLWLRSAIFALGVFAFAVGNAWIGSRSYLALIIQARESVPEENQDLLNTLLLDASFFNESLLTVVRISIALISITFFVLVMRGRTSYPRWLAVFNPILLVLLCFLIYFLAPSIGGYLMPAAMNVAHFILFTLSSYICFKLYKDDRKQKESVV